MKTRANLTVFAVLSFALTLSCGDDTVTDTGPAYSRDTPEDLVDALAYSMAHKDTAHYLAWRDAVADWMAAPRQGVPYTGLMPRD